MYIIYLNNIISKNKRKNIFSKFNFIK